MGLDVIVLLVLIGLTLHGYRQGFLKGASSLLTPAISIWLALRNSRALAHWFTPNGGSSPTSLVLAVLVIFMVTFLGAKLLCSVLGRLFERLHIWSLDRYLGGALGLVKATALVWIAIAFVFIAYPSGRRAICRAPISTQILLFGEGMPVLQRGLNGASNYITALADPLKRYNLPTLPGGDSANTESNRRAIEGLNLLGD